MPVALVNNFVLLPHPADWSTPPAWKRAWQTGIAAALTGAEQRQGLRALGRVELTFAITALSLEERAVLDERLDAASKSGLACAPFWGRGVPMVFAFGNTLILDSAAWPWTVNDYVLFQQPNAPQSAYLNYEVRQVTAVGNPPAGAQLTLSAALAGNYPTGALCWPLLFGKFKMDKQGGITSWHGDVKVTISELTARNQQPPVGNAPGPGGPGIGNWAIGSTFQVQ